MSLAIWSTAPIPAAVDRPEYCSTVAPISAFLFDFTVTVGRVPPPAVIGALQTLSSVSSDAVKCVSSVYVLPALSVTAEAVAAAALQTPTSTTIRSPVVTFATGCSARLVTFFARLLTCCTKVGDVLVAAGAPPATTEMTATHAARAATTRRNFGGMAHQRMLGGDPGAVRPFLGGLPGAALT